MSESRILLRKRGFLAVLCILVILAGAMLAPVTGGSTPAVLVPLAPLFGFIVLLAVRPSDPTPAYSSYIPGPRPGRAPPAA